MSKLSSSTLVEVHSNEIILEGFKETLTSSNPIGENIR
jgi:hypothetical protein